MARGGNIMENAKEFMKPTCVMVGQDGNVFNLIGLAGRALKKAGYPEKAKEMSSRVMSEAKSYDEALVMMMEYVDVK